MIKNFNIFKKKNIDKFDYVNSSYRKINVYKLINDYVRCKGEESIQDMLREVILENNIRFTDNVMHEEVYGKVKELNWNKRTTPITNLPSGVFVSIYLYGSKNTYTLSLSASLSDDEHSIIMYNNELSDIEKEIDMCNNAVKFNL